MLEQLERILGQYDQNSKTSAAEDFQACQAGTEAFNKTIMDACLAAHEKGRGGWHRPTECTIQYLVKLFKEAAEQGNVIKVGVYAMMLHARGVTNIREDVIKAELSELSNKIDKLVVAQMQLQEIIDGKLDSDLDSAQWSSVFQTNSILSRQIREADAKRLAHLKALGEK